MMEGVSFSDGKDAIINLMEMRNSRTLCDVNIVKGSSVIYAHSCVIAAKSSFLLDFLLNFSEYDWSVKRPVEVNLCSITKCETDSENCMICASRVIEYLYNGKIVIDSTHISHLINFAQNLGLRALEDLCQKIKRSGKVKIESNKNDSLIPSNVNKFAFGEVKKPPTGILNKSNDTSENMEPDRAALNNKIEEFDRGCFDKVSKEFCRECNLCFDSSKMVETHKKVFHTKQFVCLSCDFRTHKLSYILFHLDFMDHEENCCSVCLYEASDRKSLKDHLKDHHLLLPFKCYDCGSMFKGRKEWLKHMLNHQNGSYTCKKCGSSFFSKASLNLHNSSHSDTTANFICEVCGYRTQYKSVFARHFLKHKGKEGKEFACPVVPCSFRSHFRYNLKEHMLSHEIKKSFACNLCALKFTKERNLKRHIKTVHNQDKIVYNCCRCDYKNSRVDKAKAHCETIHPNDEEALRFIVEQHSRNKHACPPVPRKKVLKHRSNTDHDTKVDLISNCSDTALSEDSGVNKYGNIESCNDATPKNVKKSYILSETTGEFHIISENEGEQIPVASVTSTNVLTIGNFRKGTGSVTLNETTGILTFNNINSDSTGAVFLNESTGELSYINLGNESFRMDIDDRDKPSGIQTHLNEFTSEINDDDFIFDSFDMDFTNEDSCDGFDDLDGILFEPVDVENTDHLDILMPDNDKEDPDVIPHLNETTGELSFDYIESKKNANEVWQSTHNNFRKEVNLEEENEESYRVLLNEFTGEFS